MNEAVLAFEGVTRRFGKREAVTGLSLEVDIPMGDASGCSGSTPSCGVSRCVLA